jgi:serine/threonine-protein kinase SRPK3
MGSQEELSPFQRDVRTIDPKLLTDAMGGGDRPPEEPLLLGIDDGFGYHTTVAPGRALGKYIFVRKVRSRITPP